ncbi:PepSY-associated TM helix domain-containing protein [Sphingomonas sp. Leaf33]|uniref:PepSY-associated TM helix domain-containing protein n=1 Tax=Sphingomonas sp. Leaf33 TaxID=1736215 RepID=UPI0009E8863D|nr:PepSY-associated TM helix domain-containing protein [Sphingomonas sp. Leaf33]
MKHDPIVAAEPGLVQRALGGHAALGLLAGALLYLIALSGMLVVIHERWQRWEQPAVAETPAMTPTAVQAAVATKAAIDAAAGKAASTHLYVHMPTAGLPRTVVTSDHGAIYVDAAGRDAGPEAHAWTEFLVNLHTYLHLPTTIGIILVGALGVMLAALAITGVVAHPRILRDAFRLRARGNRQLAQADWHNRLGVWTLPFVVALGMTGAIIGLSSVGADLLGKRYHGGDTLAAYAPIFGAEHPVDKRPAALPDVAAPLRYMAKTFPDVTPTYVTIHDPGTRGQNIQLLAAHDRRLIYGEAYHFDAAGRYEGRLGLSDGPLGRQAAASLYNLHFGSFGGLAVELAYIALGLALCVVTATGMSLWLQKRRRRGLPSPRLEGFWTMVVWGTPVVIVGALWLRALGGAAMPLVPVFWSSLAAVVAVGMIVPRLADPRALRLILAAMVAMTALVHFTLTPLGLPAIWAIDLALLSVAAVLVAVELGRKRAAS